MSSTDTIASNREAYSVPAAEFEPIQGEIQRSFEKIWAQPLDVVRNQLLETPPELPDDTPTDLVIAHRKVPVTDGTDVEIKIYKSPQTPSNATLFFVTHGGGWATGSHEMEEAQNRLVAGKSKAVVVSVDYRLAPEYQYPCAVNDSFDVLKWCIANPDAVGIDPTKIVLGGGSAGGNLCAALAQKARDEHVSGVIGQALNIPVTCHPKLFPTDKYAYTSYQQNREAPITSGPLMQWFWALYLPKEERDAYASPLLAKSFEGLPPALVQVAGMDPLRDEGIAYAQALQDAGVPVTLRIFPGLPHAFYMFKYLTATAEYLHNVADFVTAVGNGKSGLPKLESA